MNQPNQVPDTSFQRRSSVDSINSSTLRTIMNSSTLEDSIINCNREKKRRSIDGSHPRRRETIDSIPRSNNGRASSFHTTPRRVSWSDRYSVSFFDGGKSPARCCATGSVAQFLSCKDGEIALGMTPVFPSLPFASPHRGEKTGMTMNTTNSVVKLNDDELSYHDVASYEVHLKTISSFTSEEDSTSAIILHKILGYTLGEAPKCNDHMTIPTTHKEGIKYASTLQPLDFAFILCNDGNWTYSIVCDITHDKDRTEQPRIRFVLDRYGSTKSIPRKNWGHKIRLVNRCR